MANKVVHLPVLDFGATLRKDNWWIGPAITFVILMGFICYATFRAFENDYYRVGPYLSPFYSPLIPTAGWGIPFLSPAMLILPGPAGFRLTCYYYRKAYYRAFAMDPPACAVGEGGRHDNYNGETKLLIFQNLHRFALYVALGFLVILWHDVYKALWFRDPYGTEASFGVGVGTLVLALNTALLTGYTFSCHSLRHLIGGSVDSYSTAPFGQLRHALWRGVSRLNQNHMFFAWTSLFAVALADLYVRMVSLRVIQDVRIL
ncbi:hypothetical protein [Pendulispora albinea]|uniref:Succinate dehydrogenase n=1 Tax=Pendulispora albinea TaxID=2741071 RepID=A0ABZ2LPV3_9BACT